MEYRRKRRKRRAPAGGGSGTAKAIAALLIVAAIVYVLSASKLGTWISQALIAPVFSAIDSWLGGEPVQQAPTPPSSTIAPAGAGASQDKKSVTDDIVFSAAECYALQMGVYSDKTNADAEANALKARGAGGYVMEDAGRFRVLAAAYTAKESLDQMRAQLQTEGIESAAYAFAVQESTLRITGTAAQLAGIKAGFDAVCNLQAAMAQAALTFDQQQQTPAAGKEAANALLETLRAQSAPFTAVAQAEHPVVEAVKACLFACEEALVALAGEQTESFVDFSSKMKYTHISVIHAYDRLAKAIVAA